MKMKNLFLKAIKQTGNYLERKYRGLKVEKFEKKLNNEASS